MNNCYWKRVQALKLKNIDKEPKTQKDYVHKPMSAWQETMVEEETLMFIAEFNCISILALPTTTR